MTTYRLFPSTTPSSGNLLGTGYTLGTQFTVSQPCTLIRVWFYSPPGVLVLPSRCGVWDVLSELTVPGGDIAAPAWSGGAGAGWIFVHCGGASAVLNAGHSYKVAVFAITGTPWFEVTDNYWTSGPGSAGITSGLISAPADSAANPGQGSYSTATGVWNYPDCGGGGGNYWIDAEVDPSPVPAAAQPFSRGMW